MENGSIWRSIFNEENINNSACHSGYYNVCVFVPKTHLRECNKRLYEHNGGKGDNSM